MKFLTKSMTILSTSTILFFSAQPYTLNVINRSTEPIYFKYQGIGLFSNILSKNPCDQDIIFPKDGPIAPNQRKGNTLSGICAGVCFASMQILNAQKQQVTYTSWTMGKCRDTTMYVTNLKDGHIGSWTISDFDPGQVVDPARFKAYVSPLPQAPGGPPLKVAPMSPDLKSALNLNNKEALETYLNNHVSNHSPKDTIDANLAFIAEYFKQHPMETDSVNIQGQTPLYMLLKTYQYESMKSMLSHNAMQQGVYAIIESLLRTYRVNPNATAQDDKAPLSIAIELAEPDLVQMLLYSGADVGMITKSLLLRTSIAVYNFVTDWATKKGIPFKAEAPIIVQPQPVAAPKPTPFTHQYLTEISFQDHKASDLLGQVAFSDQQPKYCAQYQSQRGIPEVNRGTPRCIEWITPSENKAKQSGWSFSANNTFSKGEIVLIHFANMGQADNQYKAPLVDSLVYGIVLLDTSKDRLGHPINDLYIQIEDQKISIPQEASNVGKYVGKD